MKNKKARDSQGLFVTEGTKLFLESPKDRIVQVLMTKEYETEHPDVLRQIPENCAVIDGMEKGRFASLADTKSPQGILTVIRKPEKIRLDLTRPEDLKMIGSFGKTPFFVILENLQDPGNAGTILRTGEAAGVSAVFLTEGSVDLYSPKTIRSTMGSIFRVPHFYVRDVPSFLEAVKLRNYSGNRKKNPAENEENIVSYAAHLRGDRSYTDCDFRKGTVLVIGNEGNGITDRTADACDVLMKIPMEGKVESLNAAMAAGILMYEVKRQRRFGNQREYSDCPRLSG